MDRLLELINRKFLKDSEFLELEDNDTIVQVENDMMDANTSQPTEVYLYLFS